MQYNKKVDEIIVSILLQNERMSYLKLKGEVEKVIYPKHDRHLSKSVYKFHIDQLLKDKVLHKEDDGKRGKEVYYSLTKAAKKKRQINILGIDPDQILFRNIYADLFFSQLDTSSHSYIIDDLDAFLSEIPASRKDLIALDKVNNLADAFSEFSRYHYFSKEYEDPLTSRMKSASSTRVEWEQQLAEIMNVERYVQPVPGTRLIDLSDNDSIKVYKPISGISISERKFKLFRGTSRKPKEVIEYIARVPGISIDDYMDDMTKKSHISRRYKREHIEHAFDLLEKEGLIKRITVRHKPRYVIADNALVEFINDLNRFWLLELRLLQTKWNYFEVPTEKEKERITLRSLQHILRSTDLVRNEFKKIERQKPIADFLEVKKELEKYFKKLEYEVQGSIKDIKKRHGEILQKYDFLHDVIGIVCPAVLQK